MVYPNKQVRAIKSSATLIKLFFLLLLPLFPLDANLIDMNSSDQNILDKVQIYIANSSLSLEDIQTKNHFHENNSRDINLGFIRNKAVWIRFSLQNNSNLPLSKILEVHNPLLEEVILYNEKGKTIKRGMLHVSKFQTTIEPSFLLTVEANSTNRYYLKVLNTTTSLRFLLFLKNPNFFLHEDHLQQTRIMLSIGIIIALFLYNMLLYIYSKEISYFYYSLYLATLVLQQLTYLGITPLFFPNLFVYLDNLSVVLKVNGMYIVAALFAKEFLNTKKYQNINRVYNIIIVLALIEIPLFGTPWFYYPEVGIITGLIFVLFNIFAAVYIYKKGYKQARFFIAGWSVLVVGFVLMIADGLGLISIMYKMPNFILYATVLEALLLSLAFTDRYALLREEKEKSDRLLVESLESRQVVIEAEIKKQTENLFHALESKKILLKELHHRTKNNLQLILSIVRMQTESVEPSLKNQFVDLANRIIAISKTHEMLYFKENLQAIDMNEYIYELCDKVEHSFYSNDIFFQINAQNIYLPITEASYVGLIINEIVINSMKHAKVQKLLINISIKREQKEYLLMVSDNGKGYTHDVDAKKTLGMTLITTLVQNQLEGDLKMQTQEGVSYMIRFPI